MLKHLTMRSALISLTVVMTGMSAGKGSLFGLGIVFLVEFFQKLHQVYEENRA